MSKHVTCACGIDFTLSHEDEPIRLFQEHARREHGMEVPREKVLEMAHDH